jgi:hypothetical protein
MSRAARLLDLMQLLRRHRAPVPGPVLARSLGISILELAPTETRYPRRRVAMVKEWREKQGLSTTAGN